MTVDINAIIREYTRLESKGQNTFLDNFVPPIEGEGIYILRLLPPAPGEELPFMTTRTHKINGRTFHCPCNFVDGRWVGHCPICNWYKSLWKQSDMVGDEEAKALIAEAKSIKPIERYYWNCIIRSIKLKSGEVQHNYGPKIFSCGKQLQQKLLRYWAGDPQLGIEGKGDVTDPHTGRDLRYVKRIVKSGADAFPNYNESEFLSQSPLGNAEQIKTWLAGMHDLRSLRNIKSTEELAREVRIHRKLEKDPDLDFPGDDVLPADEEFVGSKQVPTKTVPIGTTQRVSSSRATPPPVVEDDDEALAGDDDFLNKLRNM